MPFTHPDGSPLTPDEVKKLVGSLSIDPNFGGKNKDRGASRLGRLQAGIIRNAIPIGGMTGGAELGAAAGAALAPETGGLSLLLPMLGGAVGSGLANLGIRKTFPPELGGDKSESATRSFLTGAIPEGAGRGVAGALESRALTKGAEGARTSIVDALKGEDVAAQDLSDIESVFGRPLKPTPALTLKQGGGLLANDYRDAVTGPVNRLRDEYGAPLGKAYESLKGDQRLVPEDQLSLMRDQMSRVGDQVISPLSPRASAFATRIKAMAPKVDAEGIGDLSQAEALANPDLAKASDIWGQAEQKIEKLKKNPVTLDELRDARQSIQKVLDQSKGGDRYLLRNARTIVDNQLVEHLPDNMGELRRDYKNFIRRFPYEDLNRLDRAGTSREVSKYAFGGDPEISRDIVTNATPKERPMLKNAFIDHVLRDVNPDLPPEEQLKQISKTVDPYVQNGVIKDLFGSTSNDTLRTVFYAPIHRVRAAKMLEQPKQIAAFDQGYLSAIKGSKPNQREAAERGLQYFVKSLPPAEQARFMPPSIPGMTMPVAPTGQESIAAGLSQGIDKPGQMVRYGARRAQFGLPLAASRMAMGSAAGATGGAAIAATFGTIAASSAGYRALMNNGGANWAARMYASQNGRTMGRMAFEALAAMGAQASQQ